MKRNILAGLALMVFAFTGAAFTANSALQAPHYIQKPGECKQIENTGCGPNLPNQCTEVDPDDSSGPWQVHADRVSFTTCENELRRP